jgi:hypothetical protein
MTRAPVRGRQARRGADSGTADRGSDPHGEPHALDERLKQESAIHLPRETRRERLIRSVDPPAAAATAGW